VENPFIKRIKSGIISSEEELHLFYRKAAKDLHPDTSPFTRDSEAFARLTQNFEEGRLFLCSLKTEVNVQAETDRAKPTTADEESLQKVQEKDPIGDREEGFLRETAGFSEESAYPLMSIQEARQAFYSALENLSARAWPNTRGREEKDASLRKHISWAQYCWNSWQKDHEGLFGDLEAYRSQRIGLAYGARVSDLSAWEALGLFVEKAPRLLHLESDASLKIHHTLIQNLSKDALLKMQRRDNSEAVCLFIQLVSRDLLPQT